jgi:hypothetical protein
MGLPMMGIPIEGSAPTPNQLYRQLAIPAWEVCPLPESKVIVTRFGLQENAVVLAIDQWQGA